MDTLLHQLNTGPLTEGLKLLPARLDTVAARALILKIVLKESNGVYRDQLEANGKNTVIGPALGLAQFERGGACTALLKHPLTKADTLRVLAHYGVTATPDAFWRALAVNDGLAMAAARINLVWLPEALPAITDAAESHRQYVKAWRPGAWDRGSTADRQKLLERWQAIHTRVNEYLDSLV